MVTMPKNNKTILRNAFFYWLNRFWCWFLTFQNTWSIYQQLPMYTLEWLNSVMKAYTKAFKGEKKSLDYYFFLLNHWI